MPWLPRAWQCLTNPWWINLWLSAWTQTTALLPITRNFSLSTCNQIIYKMFLSWKRCDYLFMQRIDNPLNTDPSNNKKSNESTWSKEKSLARNYFFKKGIQVCWISTTKLSLTLCRVDFRNGCWSHSLVFPVGWWDLVITQLTLCKPPPLHISLCSTFVSTILISNWFAFIPLQAQMV